MAHYLTFDSSVMCTVNGTQVSSGYELHDGDVIVAGTFSQGTVFYVNDDGTHSYSDGSTVDIYDSDVVVSSSGASSN